MRFLSLFFAQALAAAAFLGSAAAGAFMVPEGQGQFIAGVGYAEASRRFDQAGTAVPAPSYRKATASGYLEYGLTPWLDFVGAPTLAHQNGSGATNSVTGSDSSALGARLLIFGRPDEVVSLQVLVQPPIGDQSLARQIAGGGGQALAIDSRAMFGTSFPVFGWPAFVDIEPGFRVHVEPLPTEARLDLAFGVRPTPRLLMLFQSFSAFAPPSGPLIERSAYSKLQATLVVDLSRVWSVQLGGFRTIAGRNAIRETGPLFALWRRF